MSLDVRSAPPAGAVEHADVTELPTEVRHRPFLMLAHMAEELGDVDGPDAAEWRAWALELGVRLGVDEPLARSAYRGNDAWR